MNPIEGLILGLATAIDAPPPAMRSARLPAGRAVHQPNAARPALERQHGKLRQGALRTELEPFLSGDSGRYIREPVVHARPLSSLAVTGGVKKAGYYTVPADALISAVLMAAGGSTKEAKLTDLQIARNGKMVW